MIKKVGAFFKKNLFYTVASAILIIAFFILVPTKTVTYAVEVSYTDYENYTEKEPYEAVEPYEAQEPYQTTETYTDKVPIQTQEPYEETETSVKVYDAPENTYYPDCGECECTEYATTYCVQCTCNVSRTITKYKTIIEYKNIDKERPVTKYETVTKYRNVTKYRDIEKTREVIGFKEEERKMETNWLFGFKVPYEFHVF